MTFVKICGILDPATAETAVEAGADALGFVFAPGRRQILPEAARTIIRRLPPDVLTVGVFVDDDPERIRLIAGYCGLDALQLHGREPPEYCRQFALPVIKAIRVGYVPGGELNRAPAYDVSYLLLDTLVPDRAGGTGRTFDWGLVAGRTFPRPVILAGGLNPDNVRRAVAAVRPYGVDVSSGVETAGRKNPAKIRRFIERAKEAV